MQQTRRDLTWNVRIALGCTSASWMVWWPEHIARWLVLIVWAVRCHGIRLWLTEKLVKGHAWAVGDSHKLPDAYLLANSRSSWEKSLIVTLWRFFFQVISGLLQAEESVIVNSDNCAQLFAHEATRVFHDRLVDDTDRVEFHTMLADILHDYFKVSLTTMTYLLCLQVIMWLLCEFEWMVCQMLSWWTGRIILCHEITGYYHKIDNITFAFKDRVKWDFTLLAPFSPNLSYTCIYNMFYYRVVYVHLIYSLTWAVSSTE